MCPCARVLLRIDPQQQQKHGGQMMEGDPENDRLQIKKKGCGLAFAQKNVKSCSSGYCCRWCVACEAELYAAPARGRDLDA